MDDLAGKLSELLESPDGMDSIRSMAQSLLGDKDLSDLGLPDLNLGGNSEQESSHETESGGPGGSPIDMQTMMKLGQAFSKMGNQSDDRTRLLLAIRPHLSDERQDRVDTAVKLLKLVSVMPMLTESGLLNGLF